MRSALGIKRSSGGTESPNRLRLSRVDRVYEQLRDLIIQGRLAPGARIGEADLARSLGASSTPVRGAVNRLLHEGFILTSKNQWRSRRSVAPLTKDDGRELYYIVGELEGLAARWAAEAEPKVRRRLVRQLKRFNQALRQLARSGRSDPTRLFDLDTGFHRACVDAAAGARLRGLIESMRPQWERYERIYSSGLAGQVVVSVNEHERIIRGIQAGDADEAELGVLANYRNAADRLERVMDSLGEQGIWR